MLSFITYKDLPEQLEIVGDDIGLQDLIDYLEAVKNSKDHMHLIIDSEIDEYPIGDKFKGEVFYAKQVRLEYSQKNTWNKPKPTNSSTKSKSG